MPNVRLMPLLVAALLVAAAPALATPAGALDPAWSGDGLAVATFSGAGTSSALQQIAVQPDGHVLAAGVEAGNPFQQTRWVIARFTPSGALDTSFGTDGRVTLDMGESGPRIGLVLLSSGRFLVAGAVHLPAGTTYDLVVAGFRADGSVDEQYGAGGVRVVSPVLGNDEAFGALVADQQDRAYVVGTTAAGTDSDVFFARVTAAGGMDGGFGGGDGVQVDALDPALDEDVADAVLSGDRLDVLGRIDSPDARAFVARYATGASLSPVNGFDGDGVALITAAGQDVAARDLAVLPDGRARVAGSAGQLALLAGLTSAGAPDGAAFPPDGRRVGVPAGVASSAWGVLVAPSGETIATGVTGADDTRGYVQRWRADGSLDPAFAASGWSQPAPTLFSSFARPVLAADGDYLVAGSSGTSAADHDATVFKVNAAPDPEPTPTPAPSPSPTPSPTATPTPTPVPETVRAADVIRLPSARRCLKKRTLRLRLRPPAGDRIASGTTRAGRARARRITGARLTGARITLRRLPRRPRVLVRVRLASGPALSLARTYRTCR